MTTYLLLFLSMVVLLAVLKIAKAILIPFALAVFFAFILYPVVKFLNWLKIPYGLAVGIVIIAVIVVCLGATFIIAGQLTSFAQELPQYQEALAGYLDKVQSAYEGVAEKFASFLPGKPVTSTGEQASNNILPQLFSGVLTGILSLFSVLSHFIFIIFILIFLLSDARSLGEKLVKAWGKTEEKRAGEIVEAIRRGIGDYIIIRCAINAGLAVVVTLCLICFGVNYAYIWGPLTGVLNFIPYLGATVGLLPPLVMAIVQNHSWFSIILLMASLLVIQNIEGNIITPKMVGERVDLNALTVILSLVLWGYIWGMVGMILAVPLTTCFKILCDHIEPLKPLGVLMGGKDS